MRGQRGRFLKGASGNPKGRPRGTANGSGPTVREIYRQVRMNNLDLLEQMLTRSLKHMQFVYKFTEMDARLHRELGPVDTEVNATQIIFNSPLSPARFAAVADPVPALPAPGRRNIENERSASAAFARSLTRDRRSGSAKDVVASSRPIW
jgi:Family of unknown function (DUF5681)